MAKPAHQRRSNRFALIGPRAWHPGEPMVPVKTLKSFVLASVELSRREADGLGLKYAGSRGWSLVTLDCGHHVFRQVVGRTVQCGHCHQERVTEEERDGS